MPERAGHESLREPRHRTERRPRTGTEPDRDHRIRGLVAQRSQGGVQVGLHAGVGQRSKHLPQLIENGRVCLPLHELPAEHASMTVVEVGHQYIETLTCELGGELVRRLPNAGAVVKHHDLRPPHPLLRTLSKDRNSGTIGLGFDHLSHDLHAADATQRRQILKMATLG